MVRIYTELNTEALDICAPYKSFTIKSHYKFGLSDETKDLMLKRDNVRLRTHYMKIIIKALRLRFLLINNSTTTTTTTKIGKDWFPD